MNALLASVALIAASLVAKASFAQMPRSFHSPLEDMIRICATAADQPAAVATFDRLGYARPSPQDLATVRNMETDNQTLRTYGGRRAIADIDAWRHAHLTSGAPIPAPTFWADDTRSALITVTTTPFGDVSCDYFGMFSNSDAFFVAMVAMAGSVREMPTGNITQLKNTLGGAPFKMTMYSMDETLAPALSAPQVLAPSSVTIEQG